MVESSKSILLFLLVSLSLVLTYQLWYGEKPTELTADDVYKRVVVETPRSMEKLITPSRIVYEEDNEISLLLKKDQDTYNQIWKALSRALQELEYDDVFTEWSSPEKSIMECLTFYFNPALPIGEDMPWLSRATKIQIDIVKLCRLKTDIDEESEDTEIVDEQLAELEKEESIAGEDEEKEWWLVLKKDDGDTIRSLSLNEELLEGLINLLEDINNDNGNVTYINLTEDLIEDKLERNLDIQAPIYVPNDEITMQPLDVEPESLNDEKLLKTFFVDYNMVRTIEEGDGGLIYTDGGKGLQVSDQGIEYSDPQKEEGNATATYREALRNCGRLISYHGGWPDGLRLEDLVFSSRGRYSYYKTEWIMYHEGYPLFVEKPTRALFNDLGLFNYTRFLFIVSESLNSGIDEENSNEHGEANEVVVASWEEALRKAISIYDAELSAVKPRLKLETIELGYVVTGNIASPKGQPVWFIQIGGDEFYLSAEDLEQINEEDIF
ncbi:MAG: two-component system activity regulator YycH [Bacillota bacterium]